MLTFERITDSHHPVLSHIKPLYENAFPLLERRTWQELLRSLNEPKMHLYAVMDNSRFIGLSVQWQLENWLYVEHLAIEPELRGHQYGRKVIDHLKQKDDGELILETELPQTEEARRRIEFYKKCGFNIVPYPYRQPPYRKQEASLPMILMATSPMQIEEYRQITSLIKHEVYKKFY